MNSWNLKITQLKEKNIFQTSIFGFHVNFAGCNAYIPGMLADSKLLIPKLMVGTLDFMIRNFVSCISWYIYIHINVYIYIHIYYLSPIFLQQPIPFHIPYRVLKTSVCPWQSSKSYVQVECSRPFRAIPGVSSGKFPLPTPTIAIRDKWRL